MPLDNAFCCNTSKEGIERKEHVWTDRQADSKVRRVERIPQDIPWKHLNIDSHMAL